MMIETRVSRAIVYEPRHILAYMRLRLFLWQLNSSQVLTDSAQRSALCHCVGLVSLTGVLQFMKGTEFVEMKRDFSYFF